MMFRITDGVHHFFKGPSTTRKWGYPSKGDEIEARFEHEGKSHERYCKILDVRQGIDDSYVDIIVNMIVPNDPFKHAIIAASQDEEILYVGDTFLRRNE